MVKIWIIKYDTSLSDRFHFRNFIKELSLCHKLFFLIPISLQPNVIDLRYFKLRILSNEINLEISKDYTVRLRHIWDQKFDFVAKTQFFLFFLKALEKWKFWFKKFTLV